METTKESRYTKYVQIFFRDVTALGGAFFYGLVSLLALAAGETELFVRLVIGFVLCVGITSLIRVFHFKNRPAKQEFHNFLERIDASSFPSLHTSRIVFMCTTLAYFFWNNYQNNYTTAFFVLVAVIVAYSRIYLKKHDWWDLLGGVVLGGVVAGIIIWF
ncbi:phosphatase PAP2 family protein [Candidatus Woesearchaeota archaeon]|nr:phosphatase PAP2 family protein [Candidatus Woesearchaeota archaeon]